jgi:hypothetical protein
MTFIAKNAMVKKSGWNAKRRDYISQAELSEYRDEYCPISCPLLGMVKFNAVVDHDHKTGRVRGVVSNEGNALLGKIENFYRGRCANSEWDLPKVLRQLAFYLEEEQGPLHPVGTRQLTKRFNRMRKDKQATLLLSMNVSDDEIDACKNSNERTKLYRKAIVQ